VQHWHLHASHRQRSCSQLGWGSIEPPAFQPGTWQVGHTVQIDVSTRHTGPTSWVQSQTQQQCCNIEATYSCPNSACLAAHGLTVVVGLLAINLTFTPPCRGRLYT
jgi:hypothetical protein